MLAVLALLLFLPLLLLLLVLLVLVIPRRDGLDRPRLLGGMDSHSSLGRLPRDRAARAAAMQALLSPDAQHLVRQYGSWADAPQTQAKHYVPSRYMSCREFLRAVEGPLAARDGLYWAMYSGSDNGDAGEAFQRALRRLLAVGSAERDALGSNSSWSAAADCPPLTLWWGPSGHTEQLHYDSVSNLHFQLAGTKVWRLFPPHHDLCPVAWNDTGLHAGHNFSTLALPSINAGVKDVRLSAALRDEIILTVRPGQCIYVPRGWWHQVSGRGGEGEGSDDNDHDDDDG